MTPAAIDAKGLIKTFRGGRIRAMDGLDFRVDPGDMTAVTGPSGGGKSTLLYLVAGLLLPDAGTVGIEGRIPTSAAEWRQLRQRSIGLVFQEDWLLPTLTAAENIQLPMIGVEKDKSARKARVDTLLGQVNARNFSDRLPAEMSGGERQRVAVARGLANSPRILLADEPTGELDSTNAAMILDLLKQLHDQEELTVVVVTHDVGVAAACQRHYRVKDGRGSYIEDPAMDDPV